MRIVHRICFCATAKQVRELERLDVVVPPGITLPGGGEPLVAFDVAEDHPNWHILRELFERWGTSNFVSTVFNEQEIRVAKWLGVLPTWHHGYPQPRADSFGHRDVTYDTREYCEKCGAGLRQKAPLQMRGEPRWGPRSVLQLNWIFDEYFVRPELWKDVFEPLGITCLPVTSRSGKELQSVVQLAITESLSLDMDSVPADECRSCGRKRYLPWTRGPLPALTAEPHAPLAQSEQQFGRGGASNSAVICSGEIARTLLDRKVRGVTFHVVRDR